MVRYIRTFILLALMLLGNAASAKQTERIIIFNGYFFNELPSAVKSSVAAQDMKMFFIETPNETKAVGIYSPSVELSVESLRYAVPVENVREGKGTFAPIQQAKGKFRQYQFRDVSD